MKQSKKKRFAEAEQDVLRILREVANDYAQKKVDAPQPEQVVDTILKILREKKLIK